MSQGLFFFLEIGAIMIYSHFIQLMENIQSYEKVFAFSQIFFIYWNALNAT